MDSVDIATPLAWWPLFLHEQLVSLSQRKKQITRSFVYRLVGKMLRQLVDLFLSFSPYLAIPYTRSFCPPLYTTRGEYQSRHMDGAVDCCVSTQIGHVTRSFATFVRHSSAKPSRADALFAWDGWTGIHFIVRNHPHYYHRSTRQNGKKVGL